MAFDDRLVGSDSFDAQGATQDLIRDIDRSPSPPPIDTSAQALTTRLARKLNEKPPPEPKAEEPEIQLGAGDTPASAEPTAGDLNLGAGDYPAGKPPPAPTPPDPGGTMGALVKGVPHGAIAGTGEIMKRAGQQYAETQPYLQSLQYDELGNVVEQKPIVDPNKDLRQQAARIEAQKPPAQQTPAEKAIVDQAKAKENPLTRAGRATEEFADAYVPLSDEQKASMVGKVTTGLGGLLPYVAASALFTPAGAGAAALGGAVTGAAGMGLQSYGDTYDEALRKGASDEDAAKAAGYSGLVGAALGGLPVAAILKPVKDYMPGASGWAAKQLNAFLSTPAMQKIIAATPNMLKTPLAQKLEVGSVTFAAVVEAQQFLGDRIAQTFYEPQYRGKMQGDRDKIQAQIDQVKQQPSTGETEAWLKQANDNVKSLDEQIATSKRGYSPDAQRIIASLLTGGLAAGAHAWMEGKPAPAAPGLPPPPGTPPPGGPSTGPGSPPPNAKPPDFKFTSPGRRDTMEKVVSSYGQGHDVKAMSDAELWNVVAARDQEHMGSKPAGGAAPEPEAAAPAEPTPPGPEPAAPKGETPPPEAEEPPEKVYQPTHEQYAALKEQGWADEDIGMMSAGQAKRAVLDAKDEGIDLEKAKAKYPLPEQPKPKPEPPKTDEEDTTGLRSMGGGMAGGLAKGLHDRMWAKVQAGETADLGQSDPMLQAAKMARARGGLQTREQYEAFAQDFGNIEERKGPEFQKKMRALVERHSLKPASPGPVKAGEAGQRPVTEAGAQPVPKGSPEPAIAGGPEPIIPQGVEGSTKAGEPAGKPVEETGPAEVTPAHHAAIDHVLGPDADKVLHVDKARAAEVLADYPGIDPATAFEYATIAGAVHQGYLTPEEAEEIYGPNTHQILEAGRQRPHEGAKPGEAEGAKPREGGGERAPEAGVVRGGGEAGEPEPAKPGTTHEPVTDDTTGGKPHPAGEAGGAGRPAEEAGRPAEAADAADHADHADAVDKKHSDAMETALDKIEHLVEAKARIEDVLKAGKAAREVLAGVPKEVKARDPEYWKQFSGVITKMMKPGYVTGKQQVEAEEAAEAAKKKPKKPAVTEVTEPEPEKPKIEDAGEKIGGARKDTWVGRGLKFEDLEGMTGAERDRYLTKDHVWERPDYAQAVADGMDPTAAALVKRIYDRLPVKPNTNYPKEETPRDFIEAMNAVREAVAKVKTVDDVKNIASVVNNSGIDWKKLQLIYPKNSSYDPLQLTSDDVRAARKAVEAGFPEMAPWTRRFMIVKRQVGVTSEQTIGGEKVTVRTGEYKDEFSVYQKNGGRISTHDTREAAEAAAKAAYDKLAEDKKQGPQEPKRPHLDNVYRDGPDYRQGRDVTSQDFVDDFGFRAVEFGNWAAQDERQKAVNLGYDALHDLARVLGIDPKALSLNGEFAIAFGSRGKGGKAAAHYEPDRRVVNMTKINGAGSLAHEWAHALDHYLGEIHSAAPYASAVKSVSSWDTTPKDADYWRQYSFLGANRNLPQKLQAAVNRLMHDMFTREEDDARASDRVQAELASARRGQQSWIDHLAKRRQQGIRQGQKQAQEQVDIWGRKIDRLEKQLAGEIPKKLVQSDYLKEATKLSGKSGDYWRRPNEMWARSLESFVFDKLAKEGHESQYLVQGVEPNRFGNGWKGNPYPTGEERKTQATDWERVFRALTAVEGKHGPATMLKGAEGLPEPVEEVVKVPKPTPQPALTDEIEAVDEASERTLPQAFADHFGAGRGFANILEARKFAKEKFGVTDNKAVEEALELGVVNAARKIAGTKHPDGYKFNKLVALYNSQPKLGTRTSTSVREQAYSTPVPLAYVAAKLAHIDATTPVYEPTAGNGALLMTADPQKAVVNEINPERAANLRSQGFTVFEMDAATSLPRDQIEEKGIERVIANPPFGSVKDEKGESKVFNLAGVADGVNYRTSEIDHAIAMEALDAMKDDGRAVLILGGVNPKVTNPEARADAYNGKAKREFYKALHDQYNVTDMFTVSGDLYERQGAAWPVDVVVINGRRRSGRPLPSVVPPRILSDWASVGGMLDGQPGAGVTEPTAAPAAPAPAAQPGLEAGGPGGGAPAGLREPGVGEPAGVRGEPEPPTTLIGERGTEPGNVPEGLRGDDRPGRDGEQPAAVDDFDAAFDNALDKAFGPAEPAADHPAEAAIEGWAETGGLPGSRNAKAEQYVELRDKTNPTDKDIARRDKLRNELAAEAAPTPTGGGRTRGPRAKPDTRTTPEVAKSAATNVVEAADEAFSALYDLFGGPKVSAGFTFDEDTYAKAKPHFEKAANRFAEFKNDLGELLNRMVAHMRDALRWSREVMEKIRPYLKQFIADLRSSPKAEAIKPQAIETENQVAYQKRSTVPGLETLAPVNMAKPMVDSLAALEHRVGDIDKFVSSELGYKKDELAKYFGAEQVDALGLAIDNIKNGKGFIIGDQTGIGKGRVNAAIIRWAIKNNRVPVFVTEKPDLYKDMYRDLQETGIEDMLKEPPRILATNAGLNLALNDTKGGPRIQTGDVKDHNTHLGKMVTDLPNHYDMVFTTYNQMQTLKGEDTARRGFLNAMADRPGGIVMIFDESHNAGGQVGGRVDPNAPPSRAQFSRDLVQKANGVFYSSATYAKRPEVMDLYAATNMSMAVDDVKDLAEAILHGGVPMMQAVASMLAKDGQYMRRERSFAGINYNTPSVPVDRDTYDGMATSLAQIQDLSKFTKRAASAMTKRMRAEGETIGGDASTGDAGASSTNFTAVMHNVVNQMLLAFKADHAADAAIAAIKRGEKPVLTVANTMEAFLKDYSDEMGVAPGGDMAGNFGHVLKKYLDRTRTVIIKEPFAKKGESRRHVLTDEELGREGVAVYNKALATIQGMDLSGLPLSPIDYIKGKIEKAGYSIGEITGRSLIVDYSGKTPVLAKRPGTDKTPAGKSKTITAFNTRPSKGGTHAVIINQSGSTGLSLHSSVKFDDKSKRSMFIVQSEANIDTHMQLLGRINRTGQVVLPEYHQMVLEAPAEKRPAAVLAKKMASLNANTTASRGSAVTAKDVPDFINQYGDAIAAGWVRDNPEEHMAMGSPVSLSEEGTPAIPDAMRKLTGRIPLRNLDRQEEIYEQLEGEYAALISQLEAAGENALEAKSVDLKAKLLERTEVQGKRNDSGSVFAAPVVMQKVSVARIGKPFKPAEVIGRVEEALTGARQAEVPIAALAGKLKDFNDPYSILGKRAAAVEIEERGNAVARFNAYSRPILDEIEKPEDQLKEQNRLNTIKDRWTTVHRMVPIGRRVVLKTDTSNLTGIVIDVRQHGAPKNPLALGSWKVRFAIADASRQIELPFGRLFPEGQSNPESQLDVEVAPMTDWYEPYEGTLDKFEHLQSEAREERYIAGGNMLAAYNWLGNRGSIINFTSDTGTVHQGIMTARGFDPVAHGVAHGQVERDPHKIRELLDASNKELKSKDGVVAIKKESPYSRSYIVTTDRAKGTGGHYYLSRELTGITGDFRSAGGKMRAFLNSSNIEQGIAALQKLGAEFKTPSTTPRPEAGEGVTLATISAPDGGVLTPEQRGEIEQAVRAAVKRVIGDAVRVEFNENIPLTEESAEAWGKEAGARSPQIVAGKYTLKNGDGLIQLSMMTEHLESNLAHEIYHAIEFQLQTRQERRLMKGETPRIRRAVRDYIRRKYNQTNDEIDAIKDDEIRAIGFEKYVMDGLEGGHVGVKRWYQKLWETLRRIKNFMLGRGYQTYEDLYRDASKGGYRDSGDRWAARQAPDVERASIGPAGRKGPPRLPETVEQLLRARNYVRLADISKKLGISKLNPVEWRTKIQDRMIRIRMMESSVGNADTALSTYQAEALNHGRSGERLEQLENRRFDPLIKEMHARDVTLGELNAYLYARHAPERNAYIDTINPAMNGEGSGMSDSDAQDILTRIGPNRMPDFQHLANMIDGINAEARQNLVDYGLIRPETADQWAQQYRYYVPLRGFDEASENDPEPSRAGVGLDQRAQVIKPALGRASIAQGPVQWVMMQAENAIVRGEKNRVGNTMLKFLRANPDKDRWQIDAPKLVRGRDPNTGMVTYFRDFRFHNDPDAFVTRVGGKPVVMRFYGNDGLNIARALKNMGTSNMGQIMRGLHTLTTMQARLNTLYNPEFALSNFARDIGEAFINMGEQNQRAFVASFTKHVMPAMKGIFQAMRDPTGTSGGAYGAAFREFDKAGGRIRFFGMKDVDDIEKNINKVLRRMEGGTFNNIAGAAEATAHAFELINGTVENATRLAAYMAARDVGMNIPDSAMLGRNMTVDFNRKGEWGSQISALWMFGGASVQGVARFGRAMQHKRVRQAAYALMVMGALGALYNILAGGDDDDGRPYYSKIPPWVRDKNMIIMWPKGMGHDGAYIKVPLPFAFSPFHVLGDRALGVAMGKDKIGDSASAFLASLGDAFNPLGNESSLWMQMVPSLIRTPLHIATNLNWTGRPIYPTKPSEKYTPESTQAFRTTSDFSKAAAAKLNEWSGGSKYKAGWIDVHPGSIDHVLEAVTGGLGRTVAGLYHAGGAALNGEFDPTKTPILRRFVGTAKDPQSDAAAYYAAREKAETEGGVNLKAARKDRATSPDAQAYIDEHPNARREEAIFKGADKRISPLRKDEDKAKDAGDMAKFRELEERIRVIQNRARKDYQELQPR